MTREEIILQLKELRQKGYTYKLIAKQAGLDNPDQLYKFINRDAPASWVQMRLEAFLRRVRPHGTEKQ